MAKLFFKYGTVGSGKSLELLKVAHNYEEQGKEVMVFTSGLDDRYGLGKITSRVGIDREAIMINPEDNVFSLLLENHDTQEKGNISTSKIYSCILIDEVQFLEKEQVRQLTQIVDELKIPVMAYGLKVDFNNKLFEGSEELLIQADKLTEIKTICNVQVCERKATMNLRLDDNGRPLYEGEQVLIGGDERYVPVCREHYYNY